MNTPDNPKNLNNLSHECMERLVNRAMNPVIPTGFSVIDNLVGGFQSPQVMLLAGRPYVGKTALFLNLATNIAGDDSVPVAIFSPGHSEAQIVSKVYNQHGMDVSRFRDASKLLMEDLSAISAVQDTLKELPLFLDDSQFQTLEEFAYKIGKLVNEEGVKVVFVDGMKFFEIPGSSNSEGQKALALQTLRDLTDKFNITTVASECFRTINNSKQIDLKEYARNGFSYETLKEYVDVAAVLYRPAVYGKDDGTNTAELTILHNRNGRRDISLELLFDQKRYSFEDVDILL